ncbi:MAG TPA: hypothetical protein VM328_12455 [Fimbriimonadaceae bacterium]|nr:hypothetical protein [Fimbriimonadaceae bacterium]
MKNWKTWTFCTLLGGAVALGCRVEAEPDTPTTTVVNTQPPVVVEDRNPDVIVEHKTPPIVIEKGPDVEIKKAETTKATTGF